EMSRAFRDAQKKSGENDSKRGSGSSASVDLREQSDSYVLRLNLPGRTLDRVNIELDGNVLHIDAPAENNAGKYEQSITLADAAGSTPEIERKAGDALIVVKVPKVSTADAPRPGAGSRIPFLPLLDDEKDILSRMDRMQREMDRVFKEQFEAFRLTPEHRDFFDLPRFGSSVDIKEEGENYVVHAYLPGRDTNNVEVTVKDRTLKIEAKAEKSDKKEGEGIVLSRKSHYAQLLTLPGGVNGDKMKVERKEGVVVVTLPKAK
ncbi:MAG TPA: Hsp20 family protein, partial [Verrucomicrobiales bacterium]|nr:Hsp20 family protein [Verrucomicrobiales bacterium]